MPTKGCEPELIETLLRRVEGGMANWKLPASVPAARAVYDIDVGQQLVED